MGQHEQAAAHERGAECCYGYQAQPGGRAERHQQKQNRDVPGILNRRPETDDGCGARDAERTRHRVADDEHHERAGEAQEDVRLLHRPCEGSAATGPALNRDDQGADGCGNQKPAGLH